MECQFLEIHAPSGLNLSQNTQYALQAALWGIEVGTLIYIFIQHEGCSTDCLELQHLILLGFAKPRWNLSFRRLCRQAWFSWSWHRRMSSCCNASLLWTDLIGRSYKRSSGIKSLYFEPERTWLWLGCLKRTLICITVINSLVMKSLNRTFVCFIC